MRLAIQQLYDLRLLMLENMYGMDVDLIGYLGFLSGNSSGLCHGDFLVLPRLKWFSRLGVEFEAGRQRHLNE